MKKKIRVLHIWNCAGVAGYLSEYMKEYYNILSVVMMRRKYDPYELGKDKALYYDCGFKFFTLMCIKASLNYDIIHIHGEDKILKIIKKYMKWNNKFIIHYHGSDIRDKWDKKEYRWKYADKIIVATPDLLDGSPEGTVCLPNVIDEKLCDYYKLNRKFNNSAFHTYQEATDKALEYASKYKLRLNIHHAKLEPMSHSDFLRKLSRYEYYIDVKKRDNIVLEALSLTGLEALYMGVKVIKWDGRRLYKMPVKHKSERVCKQLKDIYEDLM